MSRMFLQNNPGLEKHLIRAGAIKANQVVINKKEWEKASKFFKNPHISPKRLTEEQVKYQEVTDQGNPYRIKMISVPVYVPEDHETLSKLDRLTLLYTPKHFWSLLPAINLNITFKEIELNWLCFSLLIKYG